MVKSRVCQRGRNWSCASRFRSRRRSLARSPSRRGTSPKSWRGPSAANTSSTGKWRTTSSSSSDSTSWTTTRCRGRSRQPWTRLPAFPRVQAPPCHDISLPAKLLLRQSSLAPSLLDPHKLKNLLSQNSLTSLNRPRYSNHFGKKINVPYQIHIGKQTTRPQLRSRNHKYLKSIKWGKRRLIFPLNRALM